MNVEPATLSEVDLLADWWVELAAEQRAYDSHLFSEANRDLIREVIGRGVVAGTVLVARPEGDEPATEDLEEPLGFVMFSMETGRYRQDVARGIVDNLYVRPEARNRGVGSQLLEAAEGTLREAGAEAVSLDAMAENEGARRFYRRHGYRPHRIEFEKRLEE
ncbi:sporulation regulator-like protein [Halalkaliarchaeum desulfuricum]|uniref:Sporulation regulator-like protein n=1 Tax=Halalkaliarchaeum desulfuricum TaxID=2055893 RepID=A0A343TFY1_9EURY|nr:GNAT family N-acetyltransferase [Halalkaliarchaeum desulfuricum]AUX08003.1 sporulation regulator-like protein [Halalkaliarchaeum desulfuricum]